MNTFERIPERALELASRVGDGLRDAVPDSAIKWVETGAALGVAKSGARAATKLVRRNPVFAVAAVAGAGLLWYAARRRAKQNESADATEGRTKRIEAKRQSRGNGQSRRAGRRQSTASATPAS